MASEHGNLELYIRYVQPFRAIPNLRTLEDTGWLIGGPDGAAALTQPTQVEEGKTCVASPRGH